VAVLEQEAGGSTTVVPGPAGEHGVACNASRATDGGVAQVARSAERSGVSSRALIAAGAGLALDGASEFGKVVVGTGQAEILADVVAVHSGGAPSALVRARLRNGAQGAVIAHPRLSVGVRVACAGLASLAGIAESARGASSASVLLGQSLLSASRAEGAALRSLTGLVSVDVADAADGLSRRRLEPANGADVAVVLAGEGLGVASVAVSARGSSTARVSAGGAKVIAVSGTPTTLVVSLRARSARFGG